MARRVSKAESTGCLLIVIAGAIVAAVAKFVEAVGIATIAAIAAAVLALVIYGAIAKSKRDAAAALARRQDLEQRYGLQAAAAIIAGTIWQGETAEQLKASLGAPVEVDSKVLNAKTREVWKYEHRGANRFALRVTLENGTVTGWQQAGK